MALSVWRTVTPKGSGSEGRPRSSLEAATSASPLSGPGGKAKSERLANGQPPSGSQAGIGCVTGQSQCLTGPG